MKQKVFITGAAGFIGHHTITYLLAHGFEVVAYDDLSAGKKEALPALTTGGVFQFIKGDITDLAATQKAMEGCTSVVHLAALTGVQRSLEKPAATFKINVIGTENVLTAARALNIKGQVIIASCASVYGTLDDTKPATEAAADAMQPLNPYAASKRMNEQQAHLYRNAYGLRVLPVRLFNVYGAGQPLHTEAGVLTHVMDSMQNGTLFTIYGDGNHTRDYVHVNDVALVMGSLLALPASIPLPPVVNMGSGLSTSLLDAIRHMVAVKRSNPRVEYRPARSGDASRACADLNALRTLLPNWQPSPFSEGVRVWLGEGK